MRLGRTFPQGTSPGSCWPRIFDSAQEVIVDQVSSDEPAFIHASFDRHDRPAKIPRIATPLSGGSSSSASSLQRSNHWVQGDNYPNKRLMLVANHSFKCRGNCPTTGWSIDQFCEVRHGQAMAHPASFLQCFWAYLLGGCLGIPPNR